jgi:hypothetical protein
MQGQEGTLRALCIDNPSVCCTRVVLSIGSVIDNSTRYGIVWGEIGAKVNGPGAIFGDTETEVHSERRVLHVRRHFWLCQGTGRCL